MGKFVDLTGMSFNRLTVIEMCDREPGKRIHWLCKCICGNYCLVPSNPLKNGRTKSCGCLANDLTSARTKTHGMTGTRIYKQWKDMVSRCFNKNRSDFKYYGGRDITVCREWSDSFETFYKDMGEPPNGYTLDRINVNGNYEPSNCIWASRLTQTINRRIQHNNTSGVSGVSYDKRISKWIADIRINNKKKYLGSFEDLSEAIAARYSAEDCHEYSIEYISRRSKK